MFSIRRAAVASVTAAALSVPLAGPAHAVVSSTPRGNTPEFNGAVAVTVVAGSKVFVGGSFTSVTTPSGTVKRRGAAAFNANTGRLLRWHPNVRGTVLSIAVAKEGVYLGGDFTRVKRSARDNVALVARKGAGKVKRSWRHSTSGDVRAIAVDRRRVYLGGEFRRVDGKVRRGLAALTRQGRLLRWNPRTSGGAVNVIEPFKKDLFVGGGFFRINGNANHPRLARITKKSGRLVGGFKPQGLHRPVIDMELVRGRIYAGIGGSGGGHAASYDLPSGRRVWEQHFDGDVQAIAVMDGSVYLGGHFAHICDGNGTGPGGACSDGAGQRRNRFAALDQGTGALQGWNPSGNTQVGVLSLTASNRHDIVVAGGDFTAPRGRLAVFGG